MATLLLLAQPCSASNKDVPALISCGKDTVAVFHDTNSPDSHYALGWTIRPLAEDAKPVDWSKWKEKNYSLAFDYAWDDEEGATPSYVMVNGIVDLVGKTFQEINLTKTYCANCSHGWNISVTWLGEKDAIVVVDRRFWTSDLLFVSTGTDSPAAVNLLEKANAQVEKVIAAKRPLASDMEITYMAEKSAAMQDGMIRLAFCADYPKGSFEDIEGTLLVVKKDLNPLLTECDANTPEDHPFTGELGVADALLNKVYGSLRELLKGEARNSLIADQRKWIILRNDQSRTNANTKVPFFGQGSTREAYITTRNNEALGLTRERVDALKKQLAAITQN